MKFITKTILLAISFLLFTFPSYANVFYVSPNGKDKNTGTSESKPWQTIARVNKQDLNPGDQVLFQGSASFSGSLRVDVSDSGTISSPVAFGTYGTGSATIASGTETGFFGYNVSGITLKNLTFTGNGSTNTADGVNFYTDKSTGAEGITLANLDVSKYKKIGVAIGSWNTQNGYRHVRVTSSKMYNNGDDGFLIYAQYPYINQDVYLWQVVASYNSDHWLVLGGVSGGVVDSSQAYENGLNTSTSSGPVGIFAYDSTNIMFQNNIAYHNHTAGTDGDGFDFGQNVSFSTMQYNSSYENDGAGYLLDHGATSGSNHDNIIQNNKSTNDARKLGYGAAQIWGRVLNVTIRNNIISISPAVSNYIAAITLANWTIPSHCISNLSVTGNTFTASGPTLVNITSDMLQCSSGIKFNANTYQGNPFLIKWGSSTYSDLVTWTATTGQN